MIRQTPPQRTVAPAAILAVALALTGALAYAQEHPLDAYVAAPDDAYAWEAVASYDADAFTVYVLDLTSQTWRSPDEVDRTTWKHWVSVYVPREVKHDTALLMIGGGRNGREAPSGPDELVAKVAVASNSICIDLKQIPNQPLEFFGDGQGRFEDDLIAYTWDKFRDTGDPTWLARMPMTKAAVRAMDAVQEFARERLDHDLTGFVVAGGSKRGWTTWTTAAVDPRVVAFCPIVIDVLNVRASMRHHWAAYGFWAPAIGDYTNHRVMDWLDEPAFDALMAVVDPYAYLDRYQQPKLILNATGDQFFLPDSSQFYYHDLPGEKLIRYVPNADHGMDESNAPETLTAWYIALLNGIPRPRFSWDIAHDDDGAVITVSCEDAPAEVVLWQATNPDARDFRVDSIGRAFVASPVEGGDGVYVARIDKPEQGWTAGVVELTFDSPGPVPLRLSTQVAVTPDVLPFADKPILPAEAESAAEEVLVGAE